MGLPVAREDKPHHYWWNNRMTDGTVAACFLDLVR